MTNRAPSPATGVLIALLAWSCTSSPEPSTLVAEAEQLRLRYAKQASLDAIEKYQQARAAWERHGDTRNAAMAGHQIGTTYWQLGALRESLSAHRAALSLARDTSDRVLESEIRSDIGVAQAYAAENEETLAEADEQCRTALELARQAGGDRALVKALSCRGEVAYFQGRREEALQVFREAGELSEKLGDERGRAETLMHQGNVYSDLTNFEQARACFERAQALWTSLGDQREQAIVLVTLARMQMRRGEYQQALNNFQQALPRLESIGDALWEAGSLTGIARVYLDMAEAGSALKYWERALRIFEAAGLKNVAIDVLMSLGAAYLASGDDVAALSRFQRALVLADELGFQRWKAFALRFIGVVYLFRQEPRQAEEYLTRSLTVQKSPGNPGDLRLEARTRADLGDAHDMLGQRAAAVQDFQAALALSASARDRVSEARGLFGLARASLGLNDLDAARRYAERSLEVAESLRTEVESRDLRASYFASVHQYHELYMDVLMRASRAHRNPDLAALAFGASERARARSLLDSLTVAGVDLRADVDPALLRREQMLKSAFDDWGRRHRRAGEGSTAKADARAFADEYRDLEEQYNQIQAEIRSRSPRYAALARPQPLSLAAVQKQVLDASTLLLEYALGPDRSYLWAVSSTGHASYELAPRAEIERSAQRVYELLTARLTARGSPRDRRQQIEQADAAYWDEASRLSQMLLGPVGGRISGKRILVVADGALQNVPFAALPIPGRREVPVPMFVEHEIVSLPSASVLAVLRQQGREREPRARAIAVLADPVFEADDPRLPAVSRAGGRRPAETSTSETSADTVETTTRALRDVGFLRDGKPSVPRLAATRREADAIVAAAPAGTTWSAIDFEASRVTAMSRELAGYRIVHFATHGLFNADHPELSGLILSLFDKQGQPQDGFLRLHDIYSLDLPADLVVLSACNTALGKSVSGEGLVGIVRGFMYAGARRVVASHWKVDDEATGELMSRFYTEMLRQNRSPAAALRQAQLGMWQQDRWRAPFYWAAFVLQGEWK